LGFFSPIIGKINKQIPNDKTFLNENSLCLNERGNKMGSLNKTTTTTPDKRGAMKLTSTCSPGLSGDKKLSGDKLEHRK
jgi:hypothetical protein